MTLRLAWAALLLAAGAWQLSVSWAGPPATAVILAAALVPLVLIVGGARFLTATAVAVVIVGAVAFYVTCVRSGLATGEVLSQGVPRLLAATRPIPATAELVLPGAAFVYLTGLWVGLRVARGGMVAAPAGAVALYTAAALLTAGRADPRGFVAAAIVALSALGWALARPVAAGVARRFVPAIGVAVGVALLIGPTVMAGAFDPRRLVEPESRLLREPSPLPRIAAWHRLGDVELLRFKAENASALRLMALNQYTGASWSAQATYRRIGTAADPRQRSAQTSVTIGALDGPWLPSPGRPLAISLSDVEVDSDSGSLAFRDDVLKPGLTYRVTSASEEPTEAQIAAATVPSGDQMRPYLLLPSAPRSFGDYARTVTDGATTAFETAVAIEFAVREGRRHDPQAPSGSSYARLETFLFRPDGSEAGAYQGTSEQFASAFAVLARTVGLPTRIVVGFASGEPDSDGTRVVRGRDARAWPEVYFSGLGWYAFDPTPLAVSGPGANTERKQLVINRLFQQVVKVTPTATPAPVPTRSRPAFPAAAPPQSVSYAPIFPAAVLAILLALLTARRVRSLRHRRAGPRGAWAEMLDVLLLIGRSPPAWKPAPEIAMEFAGFAPAGADAARQVAASTDRAAFGPDRASVAGDPAWQAMRLVRRTARLSIPWYRRLTWPFDPRPLWRRRR